MSLKRAAHSSYEDEVSSPSASAEHLPLSSRPKHLSHASEPFSGTSAVRIIFSFHISFCSHLFSHITTCHPIHTTEQRCICTHDGIISHVAQTRSGAGTIPQRASLHELGPRRPCIRAAGTKVLRLLPGKWSNICASDRHLRILRKAVLRDRVQPRVSGLRQLVLPHLLCDRVCLCTSFATSQPFLLSHNFFFPQLRHTVTVRRNNQVHQLLSGTTRGSSTYMKNVASLQRFASHTPTPLQHAFHPPPKLHNSPPSLSSFAADCANARKKHKNRFFFRTS